MDNGNIKRGFINGRNIDFAVALARGGAAGVVAEFKFGQNPSVGTSFETVWTLGGDYVFPPAATVMTVSSTDANDNAVGTGAQSVIVSGLVDDYVPDSEIVALAGQTPVPTTKNFIRVHRVQTLTAGSNEVNHGDLHVGVGTVTAGIPATTYAHVPPENGQTLAAVFTVPKGYTAYPRGAQFSVGKGDSGDVRLSIRAPGNGWNAQLAYQMYQNYVSVSPNVWTIPIPEKTDFMVEACSATGTLAVSASFELLLVNEEQARAD
jgi:hypothetical protein